MHSIGRHGLVQTVGENVTWNIPVPGDDGRVGRVGIEIDLHGMWSAAQPGQGKKLSPRSVQ